LVVRPAYSFRTKYSPEGVVALNKKRFMILIAATVVLPLGFSGCGSSGVASESGSRTQPATTQTNITTEKPSSANDKNVSGGSVASKTNTVMMKGIHNGPDGGLEIVKEGLNILTTPPTEGPEEVAWRFFRLRSEGKYEEAGQLLTGTVKGQYVDEPNQTYLREVTHAEFERLADITEIAPQEQETAGAFQRHVVYIEMNFTLRGAVPASNTKMRNGLNYYAIHLVQATKDGPWKIALLGGSPPLQK
jgi:hypothetical protein